MAGKGSKPRPIQIPEAEYATRWEMAFNQPDGGYESPLERIERDIDGAIHGVYISAHDQENITIDGILSVDDLIALSEAVRRHCL